MRDIVSQHQLVGLLRSSKIRLLTEFKIRPAGHEQPKHDGHRGQKQTLANPQPFCYRPP
ncbi:hypothetical protein D3C81_1353220 [compost metagenome]